MSAFASFNLDEPHLMKKKNLLILFGRFSKKISFFFFAILQKLLFQIQIIISFVVFLDYCFGLGIAYPPNGL